MTSTTESPPQDRGARAACLQRLATALSGYSDLAVTVRAEGPTPCLAARNTAAPDLSETVVVARFRGGLAFLWSWGERVGDASDPDSAAQAIAYLLVARGAVRPADCPPGGGCDLTVAPHGRHLRLDGPGNAITPPRS